MRKRAQFVSENQRAEVLLTDYARQLTSGGGKAGAGIPDGLAVGSLFSGIGGIDLGLERAGMRVVWQCEADPWRRAVLRRHWPDTPCYEDVARIRRVQPSRDGRLHSMSDGGAAVAVDLLCGGFPCQDLSVAGRRAGLAGERSSLFFEFARIAESLRPRWLLVENVPGLLSSNGGRDFAVVLATLAELGYGVCWRVLDSRYFGVPQRRRRVFVVGHLGADSAEPFLPFLEGGARDSQTCGPAGQDASLASLSGLGSGGPDDNDGQGGRLVTFPTLGADYARQAGGHPGAEESAAAVTLAGSAVRRLTPTECCRLQGFPDDWLGPPNEPPDSPRYAALGDAVTVNVAEWIGRRIMKAEHIRAEAVA